MSSAAWLRRELQLEYLTLGWNVVGSGVVLWAAIAERELVLNAAAGLWWADPVAAFVLVFYGAKEGRAALRQAGVAG